ncbi:unnamed protein product [Polarella glacialis]|uniref:Uncharacterized protein n=1 Tax=Polarella glacialis TaxID=89957 RepID=A0A813KKR0_POLGL|nr:unnamed protein product [Polarella glacialis]
MNVAQRRWTGVRTCTTATPQAARSKGTSSTKPPTPCAALHDVEPVRSGNTLALLSSVEPAATAAAAVLTVRVVEAVACSALAATAAAAVARKAGPVAVLETFGAGMLGLPTPASAIVGIGAAAQTVAAGCPSFAVVD